MWVCFIDAPLLRTPHPIPPRRCGVPYPFFVMDGRILMPEVDLQELKRAIEAQHGGTATFVQAVHVTEKANIETRRGPSDADPGSNGLGWHGLHLRSC